MALYGVPNVAFIGRAGSGKSTAAQHLADTYGHTVKSFAAPLKAIARGLWGEPGREELQKLGVAVREIHEDTWVDCLARSIRGQAGRDALNDIWSAFTVDDCRFPNEAAMLRAERFVLVRLTVPRDQQILRLTANGKWQNEEQLDHESETALDDCPVDYTYENTGDVMELYEFLAKVVARELR